MTWQGLLNMLSGLKASMPSLTVGKGLLNELRDGFWLHSLLLAPPDDLVLIAKTDGSVPNAVRGQGLTDDKLLMTRPMHGYWQSNVARPIL